MRIGVKTDTSHGYGIWGKSCYKIMREHGFSDSDYQLFINDSSYIWSLSEAELEKELLYEKALADDAEITISQVHGPWRCPPLDSTPECRAERMEKMKKSIYGCAVLGAKNWVIHPIMPFGLEDADTDNAKRTFDINLEFMSMLLQTAKAYNVTVCLENMPFLNFSLSKPADILRVVKEINDESFKICLDTGHVNVFSDLSLADETRRLGNEIRALHVHDNDGTRDSHMMPHFGKINWEDFSAALRDIGYGGVFSLECQPPAKLPQLIECEMYKNLFGIADSIANS